MLSLVQQSGKTTNCLAIGTIHPLDRASFDTRMPAWRVLSYSALDAFYVIALHTRWAKKVSSIFFNHTMLVTLNTMIVCTASMTIDA